MKISKVIKQLERVRDKTGEDLDIHTWMQHEDGTTSTMPMTTPLKPGWADRRIDLSWLQHFVPIDWEYLFLVLEESIKQKEEGQSINTEMLSHAFSPGVMDINP